MIERHRAAVESQLGAAQAALASTRTRLAAERALRVRLLARLGRAIRILDAQLRRELRDRAAGRLQRRAQGPRVRGDARPADVPARREATRAGRDHGDAQREGRRVAASGRLAIAPPPSRPSRWWSPLRRGRWQGCSRSPAGAAGDPPDGARGAGRRARREQGESRQPTARAERTSRPSSPARLTWRWELGNSGGDRGVPSRRPEHPPDGRRGRPAAPSSSRARGRGRAATRRRHTSHPSRSRTGSQPSSGRRAGRVELGLRGDRRDHLKPGCRTRV